MLHKAALQKHLHQPAAITLLPAGRCCKSQAGIRADRLHEACHFAFPALSRTPPKRSRRAPVTGPCCCRALKWSRSAYRCGGSQSFAPCSRLTRWYSGTCGSQTGLANPQVCPSSSEPSNYRGAIWGISDLLCTENVRSRFLHAGKLRDLRCFPMKEGQ